jgi:pyruvyltransferase
MVARGKMDLVKVFPSFIVVRGVDPMTIFQRVKHKVIRGIGWLRRNSIRTFWFNSEVNAGDLVTPFLLTKYGFTPLLASPADTDAIVCGSLLQRLDSNYTGYILGTGFLHEGPDTPMLQAKVLVCRGVLTRDRISAPADTPLGDPGLLMGKYLPQRSPKRFKRGVILHFSDKVRPEFSAFQPQRLDDETLFIDIQQDPMAVMRGIDQCEVILSSSLHGVIFAHALDIPAVWLATQTLYRSRQYKYADYYSAVDMEPHCCLAEDHLPLLELARNAAAPDARKVAAICEGLDTAFQTLQAAHLRK